MDEKRAVDYAAERLTQAAIEGKTSRKPNETGSWTTSVYLGPRRREDVRSLGEGVAVTSQIFPGTQVVKSWLSARMQGYFGS